MPFGAELQANGDVLFQFFAPAEGRASVAIEGVDRPIEMERDGSGWFRLQTSRAGVGSLYRFVLENGDRVADPASRFQPRDVHGPSEVINPESFVWTDGAWKGRPWEETVLYELHVGTFTAIGTYESAIQYLDHLRDLGVTTIEMMCLADFAGNRNWGYDGVLLYAPDSAYGRPDDLKRFVNEAHARSISVIFDVVYNHFGPEGDSLPRYFPNICSERHCTPWGKSLNFDGDGCKEVREFIVQNAIYWVREFHADGLRLDASHAMVDESPHHILDELRERVLEAVGGGRVVHLILENEDNIAERLLRGRQGEVLGYTAQWNHDITHLLAAVLGRPCEEREHDDVDETDRLGRALAKGFVIAAEEKGKVEYECKVPPTAFIGFVQTHDLVGNRIFGDRINALVSAEALRAIQAICILLPQIPMLFMGEEWDASTPFPFFCDYHGTLADDVRRGRCEQLAKQDPAPSPEELRRAPDPQAEETMRVAQLHWDEIDQPEHRATLDWFRHILEVRRRSVLPWLRGLKETCGHYEVFQPGVLRVAWDLAEGRKLWLAANLCASPTSVTATGEGESIWEQGNVSHAGMGPWSVSWRMG